MQRPSGFTLLETLVVLAISSILLAVGVPGFRTFMLGASRAQGSTTLFAALNQARSEAVARNKIVTVCRRDYFKTSAFPECSIGSGGDWNQGWIVYQDSTGNFSSTEPDAATDLIGIFEPVGNISPTGDSEDFSILTTLTDSTHLQFLPNGRVTQAAAFILCENSGKLPEGRRIEVALSGRVSLQQMDKAETQAACPL